MKKGKGLLIAAALFAAVLGLLGCPPEADTPTVSGVTLSPGTATVTRGGTKDFSAAVNGTGDPSQRVSWTVEGNLAEGTSVNDDGRLTVAALEPAQILTVKAASTEDPSKSGTALVMVTGGGTGETVNSISISPDMTTAARSGTVAFSVSVEGPGSPSQEVIWSVSGNQKTGTSITGDGRLTVAADETSGLLKIIAVSRADPSKYNTALVTVTGGSGNDGSALTINGVSGAIMAAVTTTTISQNTKESDVMDSMIAFGESANGSPISLAWIGGNKNGTYTVVVLKDDEARYKNGVPFTNGSASVNWNDMTKITIDPIGPGIPVDPVGTPGQITFTGGMPSGTWAIYVVPNNSVSTAMDILNGTSKAVALASYALVEGNKATLVTVGALSGEFNKNGTYTITFMEGSTLKYQNNVTFKDGNADLDVSAMTVLSLY